MHNQQHDPAFNASENKGGDEILKEMKARSTGQWERGDAHLCFTGEDADLELWGHQALELLEVTEKHVKFALHTLLTIAGNDVCLNLPSGLSHDVVAAIRKIDLEKMSKIIANSNLTGKWDGENWALSSRIEYTTPLLLDNGGVPKVTDIVDTMVKAVQEDITAWEKEAASIHEAGDKLAGWKDADGNSVPDGEVVKGSAYWLWLQQPKTQS